MESVQEKLAFEDYTDVIIFENPDYSTALIGVDTYNRAVYSYEKMVEYLVLYEDHSEQDAIDWIEYNTIRSLPYMGESAPIIVKSVGGIL